MNHPHAGLFFFDFFGDPPSLISTAVVDCDELIIETFFSIDFL